MAARTTIDQSSSAHGFYDKPPKKAADVPFAASLRGNNLHTFTVTLDDIKKDIALLHKLVDVYAQQTSSKPGCSFTGATEENQDAQIKTTASNFQKVSTTALAKLKELSAQLAAHGDQGADASIIGLQQKHTQVHMRNLMGIMEHFQTLQDTYRNAEVKHLREMAMIANPDLPQKELDKLSNDKHGKAVLSSVFSIGSNTAKATYQRATARQKGIREISESVAVVAELINELKSRISEQGGQVDSIMVNVESAEQHTTQANRELRSALSYEIRSMRLKRFFAGLAVFIVILLLLYLFGDSIFGWGRHWAHDSGNGRGNGGNGNDGNDGNS